MNTTERDKDIKMLHDNHGVSTLLTDSLIANPKEARECIRFFKLMMYFFNGAIITFGVLMVIYGLSNKSIMSFASLLIGGALVIKFVFVFVRQLNAAKAMKYVALKHSLI